MATWSTYAQGWRKLAKLEEEECRVRTADAWTVVQKLASMLVSDYGVRRVWVFGSLTSGEFGSHSDIDLAVEGLPRTKLFAAGAALERIAERFSVDLVPLEDASPLLRERVLQEGKEVARGP